jgi:O-antigen/teichoic acid export membrane protein
MKLTISASKLTKLFDGPDKTARVKKNIAGSFIIKGLSVGLNFLLVPITLHYLLPVKYGIWLTLSSIITWFTFFDIGLGNGLRNRFVEALATDNQELARIYVSTAYTALIAAMLPLMLLFPIVNHFLNWALILNVSPELASEIKILAFFVFEFFFIQFILQLVSVILIADQKPAITSLMNLGVNILTLLLIVVLTITTKGSLLLAGIAMGVAPVAVFLGAHIYYYTHEYKKYAPSFKYFKRRHVWDLMSIGVKFFLIQISAIVIYSTTNMLISQLSGPAEVAYYNIAYRYFNLPIMILTIILTPFWSAITEAYYKNDLQWITKVMTKLIYSWVLFVLAVMAMLAASGIMYGIWVGKSINIPFALSLAVAIFTIFYGWMLIFVVFLNGVGKIALQLYCGIFSCLSFIPLAIFLAHRMSTPLLGVVTASIILAIINAVWPPVQYLKIVRSKAEGIWAK